MGRWALPVGQAQKGVPPTRLTPCHLGQVFAPQTVTCAHGRVSRADTSPSRASQATPPPADSITWGGLPGLGSGSSRSCCVCLLVPLAPGRVWCGLFPATDVGGAPKCGLGKSGLGIPGANFWLAGGAGCTDWPESGAIFTGWGVYWGEGCTRARRWQSVQEQGCEA